MGAAGGRWPEARDSAARWGEVRQFGDERGPAATRLRTGDVRCSRPALLAASASDRPVIVVTDGEIEDAARSRRRPARSRERTASFPATAQPDLRVTRVTGPGRVTRRGFDRLEVEVQPSGRRASANSVRSRCSPAPSARLADRAASGQGGGRARIVGAVRLRSGRAITCFASRSRDSDAEPRTDARLHLVTVAPTPGVVFLAAPADWDSRFLYRALREVGAACRCGAMSASRTTAGAR